jgi:DNA-binding transcriptional ArsR family regulator
VATFKASDGWDALGDPTRRAIVTRLAERPLAVGELAEGLPVTRQAVSQHLRVLKDAGLVSDQAAGTKRVYRLNPAGLSALRDQLDTFWSRALAGYRDIAASPPEDADGGHPPPPDPSSPAQRSDLSDSPE